MNISMREMDKAISIYVYIVTVLYIYVCIYGWVCLRTFSMRIDTLQPLTNKSQTTHMSFKGFHLL